MKILEIEEEMFLLINDVPFWHDYFPLGRFRENELAPFIYVSVLLVVLFFLRKRRIKENSFDFENKDVLSQPIANRKTKSLPFTEFNLKKAYWSLFFFFITVMLFFVFKHGLI